MKIALLGSAGSVARAPFHDERYQAWKQGRVDLIQQAHDQVHGDFDIWGCSPGCWAVCPRATRWFEVHRWEAGVSWFSPEYVQFLRNFKGPVYTGGVVPEIPNHVVYPIDYIEAKFSSYFLTSSLAHMAALAIDTIEKIRLARDSHRELQRDIARMQEREAHGLPPPERHGEAMRVHHDLPPGIDPAELLKDDSDDIIGMWGVDMAASEEYAYQRPGCQFFVLEALRRGIGFYLPPESDLMRPQPVYGISEWDHNYIKLTSRARELSARGAQMAQQKHEAELQLAGLQGEQHALNYFVSTWTSAYGMEAGKVVRIEPGTGLGSGITSLDGRPIESVQAATENQYDKWKRGQVMAAMYGGAAGGAMAGQDAKRPENKTTPVYTGADVLSTGVAPIAEVGMTATECAESLLKGPPQTVYARRPASFSEEVVQSRPRKAAKAKPKAAKRRR